MKKPNGYVIYEGPSLLDGSPIVAIALTASTNRKTGNMVQTYIIRSDVHPIEASRSGDDSSVCGDCKHRPINGGACYVTLAHGPSAVYAAYKRGAYPALQDAYPGMPAEEAVPFGLGQLGSGRMVRLGTYGDPAAVPSWVWLNLTQYASGRTGYTHQWAHVRGSEAENLRYLVMASADTPEEAQQAQAQGWRTFRVRLVDEPMAPREFVCPASDEAGKRKTCAECGACDGAQRGAKANPVIIAHGSKARRFIAIRAA